MKGERQPGEIAQLASRIGLAGDVAAKFGDLVKKLHRAFVELDAGLIEINPLVVTEAGDLVAVDAKIRRRRQCAVPASGTERPA